jgi:hypothetical protein
VSQNKLEFQIVILKTEVLGIKAVFGVRAVRGLLWRALPPIAKLGRTHREIPSNLFPFLLFFLLLPSFFYLLEA